jgi:hypothetical protein
LVSGGFALGDPITSYATTTVDAWGGTTTTIEPPSALVAFQVPCGPAYGVPLVVCALVLIAAAVSAAVARAAGRGWATGAPVAAGSLLGIAVCQLLGFRATTTGALVHEGVAISVPRPEWHLGPAPWLVLAGGVVAVMTTWELDRRPRRRPSPADEPGPRVEQPLDPALFQRPVGDRTAPDDGASGA